MQVPEYTISLLFWIAPVLAITLFFIVRRSLGNVQILAIAINLAILSGVGFLLDLLFARYFFRFPDDRMTLGILIAGIPIEEFVFYLSGFWFIILFYVFNDEYFLLKYNVPDSRYVRFARRLRRSVYLNITLRSLITLISLCGASILISQLLNPEENVRIPGYIIFLSTAAYVPWIFFWRVTRTFVNTRSLAFTVLVTLCISIIWEVTLALPRGYWDYNHEFMVGIFISFWSDLPVEAVTVWIFSSLIVLSYEYTKLLLYRRAHRRVRNQISK